VMDFRMSNGAALPPRTSPTSPPIRVRRPVLSENGRMASEASGRSVDGGVSATLAAADDQAGPNGPPSPDGVGPDVALSAVLYATRALLWIQTPAEAAAIARDLVEALGGTTIAAGNATGDALPVDVAFGADKPLLPTAPPLSIARMLLERHLPAFVLDAHRALEVADRASRIAEDATVDALTGLPNRRMLGRALGRIRSDDTLIIIDLDHFKAVNDTYGHQEGDQVLRSFGQTLNSIVRATDRVGRYGGEEFVVILEGNGAEVFLERLRTVWTQNRPRQITFSAGVAPALPDPRRAFEAADRAMYRAKHGGRDQWQWAFKEDYRESS
jgi:diguanylate cyclase (GGDEF)-like protein